MSVSALIVLLPGIRLPIRLTSVEGMQFIVQDTNKTVNWDHLQLAIASYNYHSDLVDGGCLGIRYSWPNTKKFKIAWMLLVSPR